MNDQSWQLVEHVFNIAIELPASQRPSYLDSACVDAAIRAEVESLIEAEERSKTFFENRIANAAREAASEREQAKKNKENRIGSYRLIRPLGSGSSGDVYLAERAEGADRTRFAIKVLRGASSQGEVERATELRRNLERLRHPYLNRVVGGGESPTGAPYFVMELVEGERLDAYCDRRTLSLAERIDLFRAVCSAVHYGHQNLLSHRCLKPANILIAADGTPRLMDLGLAHVRERDGGAQRRTSIYASPEQVRGDALSTATDVYALGVILFDLLSGRLPYDLRSSSAIEIERMVCELPTPFPSTLVNSRPPVNAGAEQHEAAETSSRKRGLSPEKLERRLQGDLDSIVLKAMDKDPRQRYASAEHLSEDLARWREGRPVRARGDAWSYRFGKLLRRRLGWFAIATVAAVMLTGFAVRNAVAIRDAVVERDAALRARQESDAVAEFLTEIFASADPRETRGEALTAREVLDWGVERARREMRNQPERQATVMTALSEIYGSLGLYPRAQELAEEALAKRREALGDQHSLVAASLNQTGRIERLRGRYKEAEQRYRQALEIDRIAQPPNEAAVADDLCGLALVLLASGDDQGAEAAARDSLASREALGEQPAIAESQLTLGMTLHQQRRYEEGKTALRAAAEGFRAARGDVHPDTAAALKSLGALLRDAGRLQEAEESFGKALSATLEIYGERHPAAADSLRKLADVLQKRGRINEAREMLQVALDVDRASLGENHPDVTADLQAIARLLRQQGSMEDAEAYFRAALESRLSRLEPEDPVTAGLLLELGSLVTEAGRASEGEPMLREALRILQVEAPPNAARIAEAEKALALCLAARGSVD